MSGVIRRDWRNYDESDPLAEFEGDNLRDLSRSDARLVFNAFVDGVDERIEALTGLINRTSGYLGWNLANAEGPVEVARVVGGWLDAAVEGSKRFSRTDPIGPRWRSIARDTTAILGHSLIASAPELLSWDLAVAPKSLATLHEPVVAGFDAPNPRFHVGYWGIAVSRVHRALQGSAFPDGDHQFVRLTRHALEYV